MPNPPVNIGLVGYGLAGRVFHAPVFSAAGATLVAVASSQPETVHADFPDAVVYGTPAALFADANVELVVLASPTHTHVPLMREALAAGKHVLSDKPFTATAAEADEIIACADAADRIVSCYQNRRYDADFLTLQSLLDAGELGDVLHYEAHFDRYSAGIRDRWQEKAVPGVGIHYDLGAHLIDQALVLFGMPDWVQGELHRQRPGTDIVDHFHLRMAKGHTRMDISAGMLVADSALRYRVHGTEGSWVKSHMDPQEQQLRFDGITPEQAGYGIESADRHGTLTQWREHALVSRIVPSVRGDWPRLYRELFSAIRSGSSPPVQATEARNTIAVIEAMARSSETGARVSIS